MNTEWEHYSVRYSTGESVLDSVRYQVLALVTASIWDSVRGSVREPLWGSILFNIDSEEY